MTNPNGLIVGFAGPTTGLLFTFFAEGGGALGFVFAPRNLVGTNSPFGCSMSAEPSLRFFAILYSNPNATTLRSPRR
jgi:hypothetical protein